MAEDKTAFIDNSKINPYGLEEDQLKDYQKSVQGQLDALEQRYAQPNWFKVSAGFLKPQLGGFGASLGSAFGAMGENVEQQRAAAVPIAQMRAQLAQSDILLNQNKTTSDKVKAYLSDPQNKGKLPEGQFLADLRASAPNAPAVKSIDAQIALQQKDREQAVQNIKVARELGQVPSPANLDLLDIKKPEKPVNTEKTKEPETYSSIPLNPADVKPNQKVDFGFAKIPENQMMTPQGQTKIVAEEEAATKHIERIAEFGDPIKYHQYTQNIDQLISYSEKGKRERQLLKTITNKMASDDRVTSAILAAANEGLHANLNGYSANVGAPIRTFVNSFTDKEERRVAQMLVLALDNANYAQTQLKGGLKGGLPVSEANVLTAGLLSRDMDYKVIMNSLLQLENNFNMYRDIYKGTNTLRKNYGDQLTTYAPNYQIYKSDWYNNAVNHYVDKSKEISGKYNSILSQP
jgi:hypothetical protein